MKLMPIAPAALMSMPGYVTYVLAPALTRPCWASAGVPVLTSMAYHWATSCVVDAATVWAATIVLFASAAFMIRESTFVVMLVPLGFFGATAAEYGVTATFVRVNVAEVESTFVIL